MKINKKLPLITWVWYKLHHQMLQKMIIHQDFITPKKLRVSIFFLILEKFSTNGKEFFARATQNLQDIQSFKWPRLSLEKLGEEAYEEFLVIQKLSHKSNYVTKEEKAVIQPIVNELERLWEVALIVERVSTSLDGLKNKYHNQYVKAEQDIPFLLSIVEEYFKLNSEAKTEVEKRNINEIMDDLIFFENKVIIPELRLKHPTLFK